MTRSNSILRSTPQQERPRNERLAVLEVVGDGAYAGALGASAIALWFLAIDTWLREPLWTPSLVGAVLFTDVRPDPSHDVNLALVGAYSAVHALLFLGFGAILAGWVAKRGRKPSLIAIGLVGFLGLQAGVLGGSLLIAPGLAASVGLPAITAGNLFAAFAIATYLKGWQHLPAAFRSTRASAIRLPGGGPSF